MFQYWIEKIGPISLILRANLTHKDMLALCQKYKLPNFYVNCLLSWSDLRYIDFLHVDNILKEQLWYNSNINGKPLFFEKWYRFGILSIKDIVENCRFKPRDCICGVLNSYSLLVDFRYTKLKNAIPKIWIKRISEFNTYDGNSNQTDDTDLHEYRHTMLYDYLQ